MSETFDQNLARKVDAYVERLFASEAGPLREGLGRAQAAGLPPIQVSASEGKLLFLVARIARARRMLEIGTLGGYSTAWLASALPEDGWLLSLEVNPAHASVARQNLERAGFGDRVEIRVGKAAALLGEMVERREPSFDLVFIDADKESYSEYLERALELTHAGSVILADNVIRNGRVLDPSPGDSRATGIRAFNEALASHPRLDSLILPIFRDALDGLSISLVK